MEACSRRLSFRECRIDAEMRQPFLFVKFGSVPQPINRHDLFTFEANQQRRIVLMRHGERTNKAQFSTDRRQ